jgi:hypothetical protein
MRMKGLPLLEVEGREAIGSNGTGDTGRTSTATGSGLGKSEPLAATDDARCSSIGRQMSDTWIVKATAVMVRMQRRTIRAIAAATLWALPLPLSLAPGE